MILACRPMHLVAENFGDMGGVDYVVVNAIHDVRFSRFGRDLVCTIWLKEKG